MDKIVRTSNGKEKVSFKFSENNDSIAKNKTINNNDNDDNTKNKSHNIILLQKSKKLYCKKKFVFF